MTEARYLRNGKIAAMFGDTPCIFEDDMSDPMRRALQDWLDLDSRNKIEPALPAISIDDVNATCDTEQ